MENKRYGGNSSSWTCDKCGKEIHGTSLVHECLPKKELSKEQLAEIEMMPVLGNDKKLIPEIPMTLLNEEWAKKNHGQTLSRLKQRGGLCFSEISAIAEQREWKDQTTASSLLSISKALTAAASKHLLQNMEKDSRIKELEDGLRTMITEYVYAVKIIAEAAGMAYSENNVIISAKQLLNPK